MHLISSSTSSSSLSTTTLRMNNFLQRDPRRTFRHSYSTCPRHSIGPSHSGRVNDAEGTQLVV
jgi:hypothetical protein